MLNVKKTLTKVLNSLSLNVMGRPDFANATHTSFNWGTPFTISNTGWLVVDANTKSDASLCVLKCNGIRIWSCTGSTSNSRYFTNIIPISKGDVLTASLDTGTVTLNIYFVPIIVGGVLNRLKNLIFSRNREEVGVC